MQEKKNYQIHIVLKKKIVDIKPGDGDEEATQQKVMHFFCF